MPCLADMIEEYIRMLVDQGRGIAQIQRVAVAALFGCTPSQVTYVITSRFRPERGYVTESRRGGGGFIRVRRLTLREELLGDVMGAFGSSCTQGEAYDLISRLEEEGYLDARSARMMKAAVARETLMVDPPLRDVVRASILKAMLSACFVNEDADEVGGSSGG